MTHTVPREVLEAVTEDTNLLPKEKETTLRLTKWEEEAHVYTAEAGLARRLLAHPHVPIDGLTVLDGDARRDVSVDGFDGREVVGVRARVPVGALSVRSSPRSSTQHAEIVSSRVLAEVQES